MLVGLLWNHLPTHALESIASSYALLEPPDRRRYSRLVLSQLALALMDLLGVLLIGAVGLYAGAMLSGTAAPLSLGSIGLPTIGPNSSGSLFLALGSIAAILLLTKSALFAVISYAIYRFLGRCHVNVAGNLLGCFTAMPLSFVTERSSQTVGFAVYVGTQAATVGVLGSLSILVSEATVASLLALLLLFVDPVAALVSGAIFLLAAIAGHRLLSRRVHILGRRYSARQIATIKEIQGEVSNFRGLSVSQRLVQASINATVAMVPGAKAHAQSQFLAQIPKLIYDVSMVFAAVAIVCVVAATRGVEGAIASLVLFLAAGSRIVPSLLRASTAGVSLSHAVGVAEPALQLELDMRRHVEVPPNPQLSDVRPRSENFDPTVSLTSLSFSYGDGLRPTLEDLSLDIPSGSLVGIVGPSGAGKSTLADVLLGLLPPTEGKVSISGISPIEARITWPGEIAYVQQQGSLVEGTLRTNVAYGLNSEEIDDERILEVLCLVGLSEFVSEMPDGLNTWIGEAGANVSGGQAQRLTLARGLYSRPRLLVLDEATSSIDHSTEATITKTLEDMRGTVTRIVIAHRLATIRNADKFIYIERGRTFVADSLSALSYAAPEFVRQARLSGHL